MPISLIKKNQLDPNIADLVGQYGSGFFLPVSVSGDLTGFINNFLENYNAVESINGINGFLNITGVSGINITTGNDPNSIVINYTGVPVPPNLVYTTGSQVVSGSTDFVGGLTISGNPVSTGTNNLSNNGYRVRLDERGILNFPTSGTLGDTFGDGGITLLSPSGKYSELASNDGNVYAWTADADYGNPYGGGFAIGTNSSTGNGYVWYFGNDGLFHFPDGSAQTRAYTGIDLSNYINSQDFNNFINSLSGIYATYDQLTGLSGYEDSITNLLATYDQLTGYSGFQATVDAAFATYSQLTGLSGYDAAVADLATTGSTLYSLISSLSGNLTGNYTKSDDFQVAISGVTQIAIGYSMLSAQVYTSGLSGYVSSNFYSANNPSGFITGVDLSSYYPKNNPSGFITGVDLSAYTLNANTGSFVTVTQTGAFYATNNPSGFITGVDLSSYYPKNNPSGFITGVDLSKYLTGVDLSSYYSNNNPSGFITGVDLSSYYPNNNPSGFITGVDLSSYATLTGLQTGLSGITQVAIAYSMLSAQVYTSGLSGYIQNNFYTTSNPSGFITGLNLSGYLLKSQTGTFYPATNPSGYITGVDLSNYTLKSQTGSFITSAQTGAFYAATNPSGYITGVDLSSYITTGYVFDGDLSGYLPSLSINKIQGNPVSAQSPVGGQTLQWNGTAWVPGVIPAGGNGGGGLVYYFDFGNQTGIAPSGGLPTTGDNRLSLLGKQYEIGSGQAMSAELDPRYSEHLICSFVTASGNPGVTNIPAGLWDLNIWASVNSASTVQCSVRAVVNIYNPITSGYRYLASTDDVYLYEADTVAQYTLNATVPQTGITTNERIYIQIFGKKYTTSNRNITLYFDIYRPSHVHTTIPSVAGNGVVKVVNGVMQSPATGIFDSDVDANAQIQQSKIQGLTTSLASLYPNSNPSGYITGIDLSSYTLKSQTGSFITSAQTGAFYAATNPSGYITGVDLSSYYPKNNPSGFVSSSGATFTTLPTVNGTGILLSGQAAALPSGIIYNTGDQNISGFKTFNNSLTLSNNIIVSGTGVMNGGNIITGNATITSIVYMTQAAYNAITPVSNILYIVT